MSRHDAIRIMQSFLGREYVVVDVDLDNDGDWFGVIEPINEEGNSVGTINLAYHGRCAPQVWWD